VHVPVASLPILASPYPAGWPLALWRFEAASRSLALRLASSPRQGFDPADYSGDRSGGYMANGLFHGELLSAHEIDQA